MHSLRAVIAGELPLAPVLDEAYTTLSIADHAQVLELFHDTAELLVVQIHLEPDLGIVERPILCEQEYATNRAIIGQGEDDGPAPQN